MKKRIITLLSITLLTANISFAEYAYIDSDDFTGDAFFTPPVLKEKQIEQNNGSSGRQPATPPLKKLRLKIKKKMQMQDAEKLELAPTAPQDSIFNAQTEMSEYVSKDLKDNFDDYSMPDGFEADEEAISEHSKRHFWSKKDRSAKKNLENKDSDNIILDSENINYDTNNYCIVATGNVSVNFVKHDSVIKADKITYDRMNNTIKAEGNVHILKNGQTINGDYIFVDMNEENALIENPLTQTAEITMRAQRGYVYGDKIVQENGVIDVDKSFNINFSSLNSGPNIGKMIPPPKEQITDAGKRISIKAKEIKVTQKGELEIVDLKRVSIFRGNKKILSVPPAKIYTNKNFDFADTSSMELGSFRGLGMYLGYGHVFEIPGGSILKVMPILNYKSGFGIGGIARYNSASNWTQASYGTAASKFMIRGKQKLDDNLSLQYVMNDYMPEWFLGRRRAKYGASLVYKNGYSQDSFLIKGQASSFAHQFDFGYFQDIDEDKSYDRPGGSELGTIRTRYMAQVNQNLFSHRNILNPKPRKDCQI